MSAERNQLAALLGVLLLTACDLKPPAPGRSTESASPAPVTPAVPAPSTDHPAAATVQAPAPATITRTVYGEPRHRYTLPGATNLYPAFDATELGRKLQVERANGKTVLRLPLAREEAIWGFGQRMDAFDLRGTSFEVWAEDSWNRTDTSYFAVPWLVSSHGYGLFINCTGRLKVDVGRREAPAACSSKSPRRAWKSGPSPARPRTWSAVTPTWWDAPTPCPTGPSAPGFRATRFSAPTKWTAISRARKNTG
jgi:hypothetical protein